MGDQVPGNLSPAWGCWGAFQQERRLHTARLPGHLLVRWGHRQGSHLLLSRQSHSCLARVSVSPSVHVSVCKISSQRSHGACSGLCLRSAASRVTSHPRSRNSQDRRLGRTDVGISSSFLTADFQKWNDETQDSGCMLLSRRRSQLRLFPIPSQDGVTGYRGGLED